MKRLILSIVLFLSIFISNAQNMTFGWNTCIGGGLGYTYVYNDNLNMYGKIPQHMITLDCNIFGVYFAYSYGSDKIFSEYDHKYNEYHSEYVVLHTYKFGPSVKLGNYKFKAVVTPYVGFMNINNKYKHDDYWYDYTDEFNRETLFMYGGKLSLIINYVEIGVHASNYDCGITLGFNFGG